MTICQNCDAPVEPSAERCEKCGAKLLHRRVIFGAERAEDFTLTAEEAFDLKEGTDDGESWDFPTRHQPSQIFVPPVQAASPRVYGGFFRRALALLLDCLFIALITAIMTALAYVGYKVGLAAHQRVISHATFGPLASFLTSAATFLSMAYFVIFHGMDGRTPGKWVMRLRVVGEDHERISYRRACLRWLVMVLLAPVLLGFLWVIWSREKRAWHDYLARTWVVIDQ
jgi:uncharacterized RDD family membrane protein YckC